MNIALIGYGYWGKIWEKILKNQTDFYLKWIYDPKLKEESIYTNNIEKVLNKDINAVIVCTPVKTHYELTKLFLEHGKHVLCEKPLTLCKRKALELVKIANEKGLVIETNYTYLHSPTIKMIKENLKNIGQTYAMESNIDGFGNFYEGEDVYSIHCPHLIAVTLYLFPETEFIIGTKNIVFSKMNTVDVGVIELETNTLNIYHHSSLRGIKKERKIVIFGSEGTIEYDATSNKQFTMKLFSEEDHRIVEKKYICKSFDETKNINRSLHKFYNTIKGKDISNIKLSVKVSEILEKVIGSVEREKTKWK